jgi:hypothetical protein
MSHNHGIPASAFEDNPSRNAPRSASASEAIKAAGDFGAGLGKIDHSLSGPLLVPLAHQPGFHVEHGLQGFLVLPDQLVQRLDPFLVVFSILGSL